LTSVFNRRSIIDIAGSNFKSQKFAYFIDDQMKIESKKLSQTGFPSAGKAFKDLISGDSYVFANSYRTRINLADACI